MRIISDEAHISLRAKIGEKAPLVGFVVLGAGTAMIFLKPSWLWPSMILVWVGFFISLIGSYLGERYVGPMAHHKKVVEALEGLDNQYTLLMYKLPVSFVLVEPGGLTTITVKSQGGEITYRGGRWLHREKMSFLRKLAGQESIGRPDQVAKDEAQDIQQLLSERLPEGIEVPVRPVILFIDANVKLETKDSPVPAFRMNGLKRWLRKGGKRPPLPRETQKSLAVVLELPME